MLSSLDSLKIRAKLLQKKKKVAGKSIPLKEALDIVAKAAGFSSWRVLKINFEVSDLLCPPRSSAYWKTWYAHYQKACEHLKKDKKSYLVPYRNQFFICDAHWIEFLGLTEEDPDVLKVGRNWVEPQDPLAWKKILLRLKKHRNVKKK